MIFQQLSHRSKVFQSAILIVKNVVCVGDLFCPFKKNIAIYFAFAGFITDQGKLLFKNTEFAELSSVSRNNFISSVMV